MPTKVKDTDMQAQYIRAIENPDSIGYKDGRWYKSPRKVDDPNNRGFGVDVKYNKKAEELTRNRQGRWLKEEEERELRNSYIDYTNDILRKWTPGILAEYPSEVKQAIASGMLYRGDGIKTILKDTKLRDAYFGGSDKEFSNAVADYYDSKNLSERAINSKAFMEDPYAHYYPPVDWGAPKFQPVSWHSDGGTLVAITKKDWNHLSAADKAEIMKMAVGSGIYNLDDIKQVYNEYAKGGSIHIDPSKKGTFTAEATKHGKSVQAFASQVLAHPENYSPATRKKANFARNASHWHGDGGNLYGEGGKKKNITSWEDRMDDYSYQFKTMEEIAKIAEKEEKERKEAIATFKNEAKKAAKDYLTESNDNTQVAVEGKKYNSHLEGRTKPHESSALDFLGAVPFAIALAPLGAGLISAGDALAATQAGTAVTNDLLSAKKAADAVKIAGVSLPTWADFALQTSMAEEGARKYKEGDRSLLTFLELSPLARPVAGIANNVYFPHLREHLFANRSPLSYDGIWNTVKETGAGVLSGRRANIENPAWMNSNLGKVLASDYAVIPSYISEEEKERYFTQFADRAAKARFDIWRLYNRLPQKYNTFVPSTKNAKAWTAPKDIAELKWIPSGALDENASTFDFVNSVGGGVGKPVITDLGSGIPDPGKVRKNFGVITLTDLWDLHPFSREGHRIVDRLQGLYEKKVAPPIYNKAVQLEGLASKFKYSKKEFDKAYKAALDAGENTDLIDFTAFPTTGFRRSVGNLFGKMAQLGYKYSIDTPEFKFLKPFSDKVAGFEVGRLVNAKPPLVINEIPYTIDTAISPEGEVVSTAMQGFNSANFLPARVIDWKKGIRTFDTRDFLNYIKKFDTSDVAKAKK